MHPAHALLRSKELHAHLRVLCILSVATLGSSTAMATQTAHTEGEILGDTASMIDPKDAKVERDIQRYAEANARYLLSYLQGDNNLNQNFKQAGDFTQTTDTASRIEGFTSQAAETIEASAFKGRYNRSKARSEENIEEWRSKPNISNPGADLANFPNSAFTLPQGRAYIEMSPLTYYGEATGQPAQFNTEYLIRYGVTDDIEARIFGNGFTWQGGSNPTTGFSPIAFDTKIHLMDEHEEWYLPAVGFEGYLQTTFLGTNPFLQGTTPGLMLNFDQSLPYEIDFEYNLGAVQQQDSVGAKAWQFSFQWAFQRDLFNQEIAVFIHGFYNSMSLPRLPTNGSLVVGSYTPTQNAVGMGLIWTPNNRVSFWAQSAIGTTQYSPSNISNLGFAVAF